MEYKEPIYNNALLNSLTGIAYPTLRDAFKFGNFYYIEKTQLKSLVSQIEKISQDFEKLVDGHFQNKPLPPKDVHRLFVRGYLSKKSGIPQRRIAEAIKFWDFSSFSQNEKQTIKKYIKEALEYIKKIPIKN